MECRPISPREVSQAKALWKQAFQDSNAYINHNFTYNIDLTFSLGLFDNSRLASMLFMLPKTLTCCDKEILTFFIAGVATDKEYRMRGLARDLLENARRFLFEKNIPVVFLYPFNHEFYKKLGFHTISWMRRLTFDRPIGEMDASYRIEWYNRSRYPDSQMMYMLYDAFALTKKAYFKRSVADFDDMLKAMFVDDGKVAVIYKHEQPVGYMCYYILHGKVHCIETVFLGKQAVQAMISGFSADYKGFILFDDSFDINGSVSEQYAMMQIVDLEKAKRFYNKKEAQQILDADMMILEQY